MPYLTGEAEISLRIIDWFVTKFSRKNFTAYDLNGQRFVVYKSYKGQLDAYNKQYFESLSPKSLNPTNNLGNPTVLECPVFFINENTFGKKNQA
jgi:hypothetical protein